MAEHSLALVTGATGFIGEHLVHRLVNEGTRVRALVRPRPHTGTDPSSLPPPLRTNAVEITWGDITDASAVARAATDVNVVFHLAGLARPWARDPDEFRRVNVDGTRNVVRASEEQGNPRLVYVSTNLVNPPRGADPNRYLLTPYQSTKREAERLVNDYVTRGGDAVIVRPTRVYGPGLMSEANAATHMIDLYRRGLFRVRIADGGARANWVHVEDVVVGCLAAARGTTGTAYTLGGENATFDRVL
ncbi:MAG: NAD-dependent epimerase/dehydratase family protein, partial [Gemmatimonadota bacterium]|nr:NAD-dependent epimerase/dehydratase family protein [Gemmatimonadota bacterium]